MSDALRHEIDYMKSLVEAGANRPLGNGAALFWAGLVFGTAALVQYGFQVQLIPMPNPWFIVADWMMAALLYFLVMILFKPKRAQANTAINKAARSVWMAVTLGIFSFGLALFPVGALSHQLESLAFMVAPFILIVYGIGWWVCGLMANRMWIKMVSIGCFVSAPLMGFMYGRADQILVYAGLLFLFATLPGYRLMREARAESVA